MKKIILAASMVALFGASSSSFAMTCKSVYTGGEVIHRGDNKTVVVFKDIYGSPFGAKATVRYRGDLNGDEERLKAKLVVNGGNRGSKWLQGGTDASNDNGAPGSTYDPNFQYKDVGKMKLRPGPNKIKFVFSLPDGKPASWAVVNKVKLEHYCAPPP